MNFIPNKPFGRVLDYFCTFSSQGHISKTRDEWKGMHTRDALTYDILFNEENGLLTAISTDIRGDLLVLLDDGWDVPIGQKHDYENDVEFGSMIPDAGKFPQYAHLSGKYRLKALIDDIKALGYAGVGLWVPSHHYHEDLSKHYGLRQKDALVVWEEIGKWCAFADVKYLKVDWGYHGRDIIYRRNMNMAVKKYAPCVVMEHVIGIFGKPYDEPINLLHKDSNYKAFMDVGKETIAISDVYRTYDTISDFADPTTLMRLAELFDLQPKTDTNMLGVFNIENSAVLSAAIGMSMGLMRHVLKDGKDDENEIIKAVKWHRMAPAFRIDGSENHYSEKFVTDTKYYPENQYSWWHKEAVTVSQTAPSVISRNAPLGVVTPDENGNVPFLASSLNPVTDAFTVAVIPRLVDGVKTDYLCDVCVSGAMTVGKIGVFGRYKSLSIEFDEDIKGRLYAQNLLSGDAVDITDRVTVSGKTLTLDGKVIDEAGYTCNDNSMPAIVLAIV